VLLALLVLAAGATAAVALSGVIGGGHTTTTRSTPSHVSIPNPLHGLDLGHAEARLTSVGLNPRTVLQSSSQLPNTVLRAVPPGGTTVAYGSTVTLYVSKGQTLVKVPKLKGMTVDDAGTALQAVGLTPTETDVDSLQPKGTVLKQDPVAGQLVNPNSSVAITVSNGPKPVPVPDVRGQDEQMAVANLKLAGLTEGSVDRVDSTTVAAGTVISTDPAGNTESTQGRAVNLLISTGPKKVPMPNVVGATADEAAIKISNAGLVPRAPTFLAVTDPAQDGKVVKTSPAAGIPTREGSSVIIRVGQYTAPTTDTTQTDTTGTGTTQTDTTQTTPGSPATPPATP
jgi:serine/threonine-protein kinase